MNIKVYFLPFKMAGDMDLDVASIIDRLLEGNFTCLADATLANLLL